MDHSFWQQRWENQQIGFHSATINPYLQHYWPELAIAPNSRVLVPLCGKTQDMLWLQKQGYRVVGVELSPLAVSAFFSENGLSPSHRELGDFRISAAGGIEIICGDFFSLSPKQLGPVAGVFDRAALVALPESMRLDYVSQLKRLLTPATPILLVSFDYDQAEMAGPPFAVDSQAIENLYQDWCDIRLLSSHDLLEQDPHFKQRGVSQMQEQVYRIQLR